MEPRDERRKATEDALRRLRAHEHGDDPNVVLQVSVGAAHQEGGLTAETHALEALGHSTEARRGSGRVLATVVGVAAALATLAEACRRVLEFFNR